MEWEDSKKVAIEIRIEFEDCPLHPIAMCSQTVYCHSKFLFHSLKSEFGHLELLAIMSL